MARVQSLVGGLRSHEPHGRAGKKEMWYIYMMDYYSAIEKSETMLFAATWMDPEIISLSEVSQTKTSILI